MTDYGFGFIAYSDAQGLMHLDISQFGDGDPRVAQTDDLFGLFANSGDYDWNPCYTLGSGLGSATKGKAMSQQLAQSIESKADNDSMSDERIQNSTTQVSITSNGDLRCNHIIQLSPDEVYVSDISIDKHGTVTSQF